MHLHEFLTSALGGRCKSLAACPAGESPSVPIGQGLSWRQSRSERCGDAKMPGSCLETNPNSWVVQSVASISIELHAIRGLLKYNISFLSISFKNLRNDYCRHCHLNNS
jgi:hypothetical protein